MAGCDRLSILSDDLLRRVLHFAPLREAASTRALSTRWHGLSRSSGAVNVETRLEDDSSPYSCTYYVEAEDPFLSWRDAFVYAAKAALVASQVAIETHLPRGGRQLRKLIYKFLYQGKDSKRIDVVPDLLSHPAARYVEELRFATRVFDCLAYSSEDQEVMLLRTGSYDLNSLYLPSETLRVLEVSGCNGFKPPAGVFPLLASLRLGFCKILLEHLQMVIDVAPALATINLESIWLKGNDDPRVTGEEVLMRLRCPSATVLLLEKCSWVEEAKAYAHGTTAVEIDGPRLRGFTYKGLLQQISLSSQAPDLARVDLRIFDEYGRTRDKNLRHVIFWRLVHNFSNVKLLKLRVNHLEDIAAVGDAERNELLRPFGDLWLLELEGLHRPKGMTAAVAIANLLRCCPVVRDLRISLTTVQGDSHKKSLHGTCLLGRKYRHDLDKSMHGYKRRRLEPMVSVKEDDEDADDAAIFDQVPDLPALSGCVFHCLQSSLRCLRMQFRQQKTNCFGLKLMKFFVENAVVLEEMRIDSGNGKMCEHMNCMVERWAAHSSKKRNTILRFLPLERKN